MRATAYFCYRKQTTLDYTESLNYLYNTVPMFSRMGKVAYKADLSGTRALCSHLGNPERNIRAIHVAGTNGKGSLCNMVAAVLQQNGLKTGLFTSPHLHDFRERIRVDGQMVSPEFVVEFLARNKNYIESDRPSFFELTFGMAMEYFASQNLDIAVIETGLGGRLDSTNVIIPELSVITNIGYDHTDILGDTLEMIAGEKAGIIKENIPVVIGETHPQTKDIFLQKARAMHSPIFFADQNYRILDHVVSEERLGVSVMELVSRETTHYFMDLTGGYELKNLLTAIQSIAVLKQIFGLKKELTQKGLSNIRKLTGFEGRWQVIHRNPTIVLDVGHNVDGIGQIVEQLQLIRYGQLHIITGMVRDKDVSGVLKLYPADARFYFTNAHIPRALPATELQDIATRLNLQGKAYEDVNDALKAAIGHAGPDDLILVCGSFFVVGEVDVKRISTETEAQISC